MEGICTTASVYRKLGCALFLCALLQGKCRLAACMSTSLSAYPPVMAIDLLHMDCLIRKKNTQIPVATST